MEVSDKKVNKNNNANCSDKPGKKVLPDICFRNIIADHISMRKKISENPLQYNGYKKCYADGFIVLGILRDHYIKRDHHKDCNGKCDL